MEIPDRLSEHTYESTTSVLFHPAVFGPGTALTVITGRVMSMFTVTVLLAVFPARSAAIPVTIWPAPSTVTGTCCGQLAIPEPESSHVNTTFTGVLFHSPIGDGLMLPVIIGGVRSTLTVTLAVDVFPAASVATS